MVPRVVDFNNRPSPAVPLCCVEGIAWRSQAGVGCVRWPRLVLRGATTRPAVKRRRCWTSFGSSPFDPSIDVYWSDGAGRGSDNSFIVCSVVGVVLVKRPSLYWWLKGSYDWANRTLEFLSLKKRSSTTKKSNYWYLSGRLVWFESAYHLAHAIHSRSLDVLCVIFTVVKRVCAYLCCVLVTCYFAIVAWYIWYL